MSNLVKCPACNEFAVAAAEWSGGTTVRCPHCQKEFLLRDASIRPLVQLARVASSDEPAATPSEPADSTTIEFPTVESNRSSDAPLATMPAIQTDDYDSLTPEQKQQLDAAAAVAARLRGSQKEKSCVGELIKMVLGAVVGLTLGYWLLNYFGGPRFDWLSVYLPGCAHTSEHWPVEYFRDKPAEPANNQPIPVVPIEDLMGPVDEMKPEGFPKVDTDTTSENETDDLPSLPGLDKVSTQDEPVNKDTNDE